MVVMVSIVTVMIAMMIVMVLMMTLERFPQTDRRPWYFVRVCKLVCVHVRYIYITNKQTTTNSMT
jgi:hypothetical protein